MIRIQKEQNPMLHRVLEAAVQAYPDTPMTFIDGSGNRTVLSYREVAVMARRRMEMLLSNGLKAHDFLVFQMYNGIDFIVTFWACMYAGIVPVLMNPIAQLEPDHSEAKVLKYIDGHLNHPFICVSSEMADEYALLLRKLDIERGQLLPLSPMERSEMCGNPVPETDALSPDDPCMIFFTSGSTGMPKCVLQTHRAAVLREQAVSQTYLAGRGVGLNWLPLEHAGGVLMGHFRSVLLGEPFIQVDKNYILQDPVRWLDLISEFRVSYSWAPHFAFVLLNQAIESGRTGNWDLSSVRRLLDGGEMVEAVSAKRFLQLLKPWKLRSDVLCPAWGMCETCSGVMYNTEFNECAESGVQFVDGRPLTEIGKPVAGVDIRIVNEENQSLEDGEIGTFQIRGAPVTLGYYNLDEANQEAFTADGWFDTGDRGFIKNSSVTLTGRDKDLVIINGLNYSNAELEAVIDAHPLVQSSFTAVCQCFAPNGKEEVVAFFVPRAHVEPLEAVDQINRHVQKTLHLQMHRVIPVAEEDIHKSNLGKILRRKIADQYTSGYFQPVLEMLEEKRRLRKEIRLPQWTFYTAFIEEPTVGSPELCTAAFRVQDAFLAEHLARYCNRSDDSDVLIFQGTAADLRRLGERIVTGEVNCKRLYVLTKRLYRISAADVASYKDAEMSGYLRCLQAECGGLSCVHIDLDAFDNESALRTVAAEVQAEQPSLFTLVLRGDKRYLVKLKQAAFPDQQAGFTYAGLYLVTGGLGGIGRLLCAYLLKYYQAKIIICGRRERKEAERSEAFRKLRTISPSVHYESIDVTDEDLLERAVARYEKRYGHSLCEIIHTAGLGNLEEHWRQREERMIGCCSEELYGQMLRAKKEGTLSLYNLAQRRENVRLLLFGSTNSFFGSASFSAYSAANSFPDLFALAKRTGKVDAICMNFSSWSQIGMSKGQDFAQIGEKKGFFDISALPGLLAIEQALGAGEPSVYIGLDDSRPYVSRYIHGSSGNYSRDENKTSGVLDETEKRLAKIWGNLLQTDICRKTDDFFEMGGESIKAFSLPQIIRQEFSVEIPLKDVFRFSRLDEMACLIKEKEEMRS